MVNQFSENDPTFGGLPGGPTVLEHYALKQYAGNTYAVAGSSMTHKYTWYLRNVRAYDNVGFLVIFFAGFFMLAWATLAFKQFQKR